MPSLPDFTACSPNLPVPWYIANQEMFVKGFNVFHLSFARKRALNAQQQ